MPKHAIEKIIARNSKKKEVITGEYTDIEVDFTLVNDFFSTTINTFTKFKPNKKVFNPNKASFCFNYFMPRPNKRALDKEKLVNSIIDNNAFSTHFDIHRGTWQEEFINNKLAQCGNVIITADSHTPALGGLGLLALGVGEYDLATSLTTGRIWIKVPEILEIKLEGETIQNVRPIDVALYVIKNMDKDILVYKVIEFTGSYVESLDITSRMILCDMFSELEIKTCYIKPSESVLSTLEKKNGAKQELIENDRNYEYSKTFSFDVSIIKPMISLSTDFTKIYEVRELQEQNIKVNDGFIGGCQGGQMKSIKPAYDVLKGKTLPPKSGLTICPASDTILEECTNLGFKKVFDSAGVKSINVGCASCLGTREDTINAKNIYLTNTLRTFCGRSSISNIIAYQASSLTIAMSILNGKITDPAQDFYQDKKETEPNDEDEENNENENQEEFISV